MCGRTKIHRQETFSEKTPPTRGPKELANTTTMPKMPLIGAAIFERYDVGDDDHGRGQNATATDTGYGAYRFERSASVPNFRGEGSAVSSRKTISMIMLCDTADRIDPTKKSDRLPSRIVFRPKMSDNRPYSGWHAVEVSRYAVPTHEEISAALNTRPRVGRAVETLYFSHSVS